MGSDGSADAITDAGAARHLPEAPRLSGRAQLRMATLRPPSATSVCPVT